jgi:hypothetical protein
VVDREPSAAQALYGHLKSGARDVVQRQREPNSVADAMFGHLKPPAPKPAPNRYRESIVNLAALADQDPWVEYQLGLMGLRRKR